MCLPKKCVRSFDHCCFVFFFYTEQKFCDCEIHNTKKKVSFFCLFLHLDFLFECNFPYDCCTKCYKKKRTNKQNKKRVRWWYPIDWWCIRKNVFTTKMKPTNGRDSEKKCVISKNNFECEIRVALQLVDTKVCECIVAYQKGAIVPKYIKRVFIYINVYIHIKRFI